MSPQYVIAYLQKGDIIGVDGARLDIDHDLLLDRRGEPWHFTKQNRVGNRALGAKLDHVSSLH